MTFVTFVALVRVEMRRALHRRVVWVLIALALLGTVALGVIAFVDSGGRTVASMRADGGHPAVMENWWEPGGDGVLMVAAIPLVIGALLGGASVAGAEWRAGTITTVLTWEPRRLRVHAARVGSCFVLAVVIAVALQALFLASTLPAVLTHGTTAGVDGGWWVALVAAIVRLATIAGGAAVIAASLATLGRNTAFALGAAFGWIAIGENLVRGLKPSLSHLLVGENLSIVLTWAQLEGAPFVRSTGVATATIVSYTAAIGALAALSFTRRDIAATT